MADRKVLHSWKEVANYMGRGVRTVQRYEAQLRLPVHRLARKAHGAVLAFSDELDAWRKEDQQPSTPSRLPIGQATEEMVRARRRLLAVAAMAKRNSEAAKTTYDACMHQAVRLREMIYRIEARRARFPKQK